MTNTTNNEARNSKPTQLHPIPAFKDNYLWLLSQQGRATVIDPGDAEPVKRYLHKHQLTLDTILITHHHRDHVGGVAELKALGDVTVYGPMGEDIPHCDIRLKQDDVIQLDTLDLELTVLDIPGHTAGHIAYFGYLDHEQPIVFCGDTLFGAGCGRLFEGTPGQMVDSLAKLTALPLETLVCCAHEYTVANIDWALQVEPNNTALQERSQSARLLRAKNRPTLPSTIGLELETNPFLRTLQPEVAASAEKWAGTPLASAIDVFASLREWKNQA